MPRRLRKAAGGEVYHVLNRGAANCKILRTQKDCLAMEKVLRETLERFPMRLLAYCLMPNHWHLIVWPRADGELSRFMNWLTLTHVQRWRHAHQTVGYGGLYQGRFRSFPIQQNEHLLVACRFVEGNPVRSKSLTDAGQWRWSSLWQRENAGDPIAELLCNDWPVARPADWRRQVNVPLTPPQIGELHRSIRRGSPFGDPLWQTRAAARLDLRSTLRPLGRPKKPDAARLA